MVHQHYFPFPGTFDYMIILMYRSLMNYCRLSVEILFQHTVQYVTVHIISSSTNAKTSLHLL